MPSFAFQNFAAPNVEDMYKELKGTKQTNHRGPLNWGWPFLFVNHAQRQVAPTKAGATTRVLKLAITRAVVTFAFE